MRDYKLSIIILLCLCVFANADNLLYWTGAGVDANWTNQDNWDTTFDPCQLNYAHIDATNNDPVINNGMITDKYRGLRCGATSYDSTLVGITMTGGEFRTLKTVNGDAADGYISFGHYFGTKTYFNFSGGLIDASGMLMPREGNCQIDITGGDITLSNYIRMGEQASHGGGTVNMTGGALRIENNSSTDRYLGIGYQNGGLCTFNFGGQADFFGQRIAVGQYGDGTLNVNGGTMRVTNGVRISTNGGHGQWNINAGTVNVSGEGIGVGFYGDGTAVLNINGGFLTVSELIIGRKTTGKVNLMAGKIKIISSTGLQFNTFTGGNGVLNICGGQLLLLGDNTSQVSNYANQGRIIAFDGLGNIESSYDSASGYTVVTGEGVLESDLNNDDIVNMLDFALLSEEWLCQSTDKKLKFTIDHTKIYQGLNNFPVLVTHNQLPSSVWQLIADDGFDICFELANGTPLQREIATIDKQAGILEIYVTIPNISSIADTVFYMNFKDSSAGSSVDVWNDDFVAVYHMNDNTKGSGIDITGVLETDSANQGLVFDGEYFYWGKDNGDDVTGSIYKIDGNGNIISTFSAPPHASGGDIREDHDTLIFSSCCGSNNREIWEIDKDSGAKIRSWIIAEAEYLNGAFVAYKEENTIYMLVSGGSEPDIMRLYEVYLYDDGSYLVLNPNNPWRHSLLGVRKQGMDYTDGYIWFSYDTYDANPNIEVVQIQLDGNGNMSVKKTIRTEIPEEAEGLVFYGEHIYFGVYIHTGTTYGHRILKICNPLMENLSMAQDSSKYKNNMAKIGYYGSGNIESPIGTACVFDGNETFAVCSNPVELASLDSFTFEVWAKLDGIDTSRRFLDLTKRWRELTSDGFAFKPNYDGSDYTLAVWTDGSWKYGNAITSPLGSYHYFAVSYDGSLIKLYYDGQIAGTYSFNGVTGDEPGALYIGASNFYSADYQKYIAKGAIDEVRVSKSPRSTAWIVASYNNIASPETFFSIEIE